MANADHRADLVAAIISAIDQADALSLHDVAAKLNSALVQLDGKGRPPKILHGFFPALSDHPDEPTQ